MDWLDRNLNWVFPFGIILLAVFVVIIVTSVPSPQHTENVEAKKVRKADVSFYRDTETGVCVGFSLATVSCDEVKNELVNPPGKK